MVLHGQARPGALLGAFGEEARLPLLDALLRVGAVPEVREHMAEEHATAASTTDDKLPARIVEAHAYDIERSRVRPLEAADVGTEEEFGPEPY